MTSIYWDYNAAAPLAPEVASLLARRAAESAQAAVNPSSVHRVGQLARARLSTARERVAAHLGCAPREVIFTGSGTEANALAIMGAFRARTDGSRTRLVTSAIEHPALLLSIAALEREGAQAVLVPPARCGAVDAAAFSAALEDPRTLLCSVMLANNETGVLQPVPAIARVARERGILFHTDAVQAAGKLPVDVRELGVDLLSISAHKLGGPPGVGALYVRRGVELQAIVPGHQELGHRGGTPDVTACEALALALDLAAGRRAATVARLEEIRDSFERRVTAAVPGAQVNGRAAARLPTTSSVTFEGVDAEALMIALDLEGIAVSMGAACASGSLSPSHVLLAMGLSPERARSTLRFSFGPATTMDEVDRVLDALRRLEPSCRRSGLR